MIGTKQSRYLLVCCQEAQAMHWHVPSLTVSSKNLSHTLVDLITTDNPFGLDHTDYPNGKFMD